MRIAFKRHIQSNLGTAAESQQQQGEEQERLNDPISTGNDSDIIQPEEGYHPNYIRLETQKKDRVSQALFSVNTDHCKIPLLDPFDRRISSHIGKSVGSNCAKYPPLFTSFEKGFLKIDRKVLHGQYGKKYTMCEYEVIHRANDSSVIFEDPKSFDADEKVEAEFLRVSCPLSMNKTYRFYHADIQRKKEVEARCKPIQDLGSSSDYLNILLVGVDSMSRSNMLRQMPQTRNYLLNSLQAFEMLGYNKIADNTLPNLIALLTGRFREELLEIKPGRKHYFDELPFIWKKYAGAGYRTMYAEDNPQNGNFNWLQYGFKKPPTDYYYRPFALAMESDRPLWWRRDCVGPETEVSLLLNYSSKFISEFHKEKYFGLVYLSRLTHDDPNRAHSIDGTFRDFLMGLKQKKHLEKSVVIFFSDHGARYGKLRETDIGSAEERLPALYISFPEWFRSKYPDYMDNLRTNQNRLTTPFDLYHTLQAIRQLDAASVLADRKYQEAKKPKPAYSLFKEVPTSRYCDPAHIASHWCMCRSVEVLDVDGRVVRNGAQFVVLHVNNLLSAYPELCAELNMLEITKAHLVHPGVLSQHSNMKTYQLTFITVPGDAMFEATLDYDVNTKTYDVTGVISRLDTYGETSQCINDPILKLYCHCKKTV